MSAAPRRVGVVGPGRVGTVLAAALEAAGYEIAGAAGRGRASRERFAARFPAARVGADLEVVAHCDVVLVTTPDDAVEPVASELARRDLVGDRQRVVHVAGSLGLAALKRPALAGAGVAACHPAQTFPAPDPEPTLLDGVAWAVTAREPDRAWAHDLVRATGGVAHDVPEESRVLYHAALVLASNATGAVVSAARQLLLAVHIDEPGSFLRPLVRASADNVTAGGASAITGPVVRGDAGTIGRHLDALDADLPELAGVYRALVRVILAQVRPTLDDDAAAGIEERLGKRP